MKTLSRMAAVAAAAVVSANAGGQQVIKPPVSQYGVDIGTRNMSIPGMPTGGMAAAMMPAGMGGGPTKELWLGLRSTQKAAAPAADHDVPPGMSMGKSLPLLGTAPVAGGREAPDEQRPPEKPKARMLVYWGCGEAIRPGQPKVADTEKMTLQQFGEALRGRSPPDSGWAMRNAQLRWPNEREPKPVPADASIRGEQFVHGSATPDIRFTIGEKQDFLAPFEASAKGSFPGPFALGWSAIPNAQGYFLQAMGHREATGEMIIWTSSEVQDTGWGLMTWLPNDFLRRMIAEKVVLPPDVTTCTVPEGCVRRRAGRHGADHCLRRGAEPRPSAAAGRSEDRLGAGLDGEGAREVDRHGAARHGRRGGRAQSRDARIRSRRHPDSRRRRRSRRIRSTTRRMPSTS